jgi:hypothetical protein
MEERILDWREVVPVLTTAEEIELITVFSTPSVLKYFRKVALEEMLKQSITPVVDIITKPEAHIGDAAYSKGRISVAQEIIDFAIAHQQARQLPLK